AAWQMRNLWPLRAHLLLLRLRIRIHSRSQSGTTLVKRIEKLALSRRFYGLSIGRLGSRPFQLGSSSTTVCVKSITLLTAPKSVALPARFREHPLVGRDSVEPFAAKGCYYRALLVIRG